jgi:LmbE family N-acetylglucosaminyl deacetylase
MCIRILLAGLLLSAFLFAGVNPDLPDSAELNLMLKKLMVVGNALYVGAHPDDENTALLAYLSLGKLMRTGYLALNRGEGGQNLIGPEQGDLLGVIRTQELLAARSVDRAEQFFTRAVDFGYSKTPEESMQKWGKENVLSDVVWVFRKFRPDVIITRFPKEGGGHGHHIASSILADEAFYAAADPSRFPEQLKYVSVWKPKRLVWNRYSWGNQPPLTDTEKASMYRIDLGEYNPLLGKSYTEIAGISRSMHKSQGFGDSQDRGRYIEYFRHTSGDPATADLFEGIDLTWKRIPGTEKIAAALQEAVNSFHPEDPSKSVPALLKAYSLMRSFPPNPWVQAKTDELREGIRACAGLWLEAIAKEPSATPGSEVKVMATAINRSGVPLILESPAQTSLPNNQPVSRELLIPVTGSYSQPYWLNQCNDSRLAEVSDPLLIGLPENPSNFHVKFSLLAGKEKLDFSVPVLYRWVDPVAGERYRAFEVAPEVAIHLNQPVTVFLGTTARTIPVTLTSLAEKVSGELRLVLPDGWKAQPEWVSFQADRKGATISNTFTVTLSPDAIGGIYTAEAHIGEKRVAKDVVQIDYPHIPPQTIFPPSQGKLIRLDIRKAGEKIGYIMGSGDQIPEALAQLGYQVTLLSDDDLISGTYNSYDAIVVGIRAYNTRGVLKAVQEKLLEYVKQGGTLVVQYNTLNDLDQENLGPHPFRISRERVSVEEAPVRILRADHPVLNFPNKITDADFEGWIQERGLYFPDQWDSLYETVIACSDPGEAPKAGGILYARYGKGAYIYTTYSWFRELPAGVPGAYRLFVNLISAGAAS